MDCATYINKKTGDHYAVTGEAINATNAQNGQKLVLYTNSEGQQFAREYTEFHAKFRPMHHPEAVTKDDKETRMQHRCMCVGFRRSLHGTCLSCGGWVS